MNKKILLFLPISIMMLGAGCNDNVWTKKRGYTPPKVESRTQSNSQNQQQSDKPGATLAGSRIKLLSSDSLEPGMVTLAFSLYGKDGRELTDIDLKIAHEKKMHLLMVRDDMTGFQHLHPSYEDGKWAVKTEPAETGQYQVYVDVEPVNEEPVVLRVPITIGGATRNPAPPIPAADRAAEADGYKVMLQTNQILRTKEDTRLVFQVTKDGKSVEAIGQYLGAYGHVVLLRHGAPDDFVHAHPLTEMKPLDGTVEFEAQFPATGRYTLYAQFNLDGVVRKFPITVDVSEEGKVPAAPSRGNEPVKHN